MIETALAHDRIVRKLGSGGMGLGRSAGPKDFTEDPLSGACSVERLVLDAGTLSKLV
jgi:hypothetical protein